MTVTSIFQQNQPVATLQPTVQPTMDECGVRISGTSGLSNALCGVKNTVQILIQIETDNAPADTKRGRLNAAVVMDKSGSMAGNKILFAKRGVRKLIKHLHKPDKLHLVAYDSYPSVQFKDGDLDAKEELTNIVRNIQTGSATNLFGGLQEAAKCFVPVDEDVHATNRIFLFSDGLVNQGETNKEKILTGVDAMVENGISISTFGIGRDFDEDLMTQIAKRGGGDYVFLKNAEVIPKLVSKSVHSFLNLAGTESRINIRGLNGAVLTKVYGLDDDDDTPGITACMGEVQIGDLHTGNLKQILIELEVSPTVASDMMDIVEFELKYKSKLNDEKTVFGTSGIGFTDRRDNLGDMNPEVSVALAIQQSNEMENEVVKLTEQGQMENAISLKERSISLMDALLSQLKQNNESLSSCSRLEKVLKRARSTLANLIEANDRGSDGIEMCMEMRYEQGIQRAMSENGYDDGCDSDDGNWSEEDLPVGGNGGNDGHQYCSDGDDDDWSSDED